MPVTVRCFIGMPLDPHAAEALGAFAEGLVTRLGPDRARVVPAERLHLTLAFLGQCSLADVGAARAAARCFAGIGTCHLEVGPVAPYGAGSVWAATLTGTDLDRLAACRVELLERLDQRGFEVDSRPFNPHVTLVRSRRRDPLPEPDAATIPQELSPNTLDLRECHVYTLAPGSHYVSERAALLDP